MPRQSPDSPIHSSAILRCSVDLAPMSADTSKNNLLLFVITYYCYLQLLQFQTVSTIAIIMRLMTSKLHKSSISKKLGRRKREASSHATTMVQGLRSSLWVSMDAMSRVRCQSLKHQPQRHLVESFQKTALTMRNKFLGPMKQTL